MNRVTRAPNERLLLFLDYSARTSYTIKKKTSEYGVEDTKVFFRFFLSGRRRLNYGEIRTRTAAIPPIGETIGAAARGGRGEKIGRVIRIVNVSAQKFRFSEQTFGKRETAKRHGGSL